MIANDKYKQLSEIEAYTFDKFPAIRMYRQHTKDISKIFYP